MNIKIVYPLRAKAKTHRRSIIKAARWPFLLAAYICPIINLCIGGQAWSVVVLWGLWVAWTSVIAPTMVEYNRISQLIKFIVEACITLVLIDVLLSPGWVLGVVPLVCFGGLVLAGILFFTDMPRQTQNMMPMLLLDIVTIVSSAVCMMVWKESVRWEFIVMGAFSLALLVTLFMILGSDLLREFKKFFHTI